MSAVGPNPNITRRVVVPSFSYQMTPVPLGHTLEALVKKHEWFITLIFNSQLSPELLKDLVFKYLVRRCDIFIRPLKMFYFKMHSFNFLMQLSI